MDARGGADGNEAEQVDVEGTGVDRALTGVEKKDDGGPGTTEAEVGRADAAGPGATGLEPAARLDVAGPDAAVPDLAGLDLAGLDLAGLDLVTSREPPTGLTTRPAPLRPGDPRELGEYRVLGRLGEGGMGTVYLARGRDTGLVAVKVIRADVARIPRYRERFRREAEAGRLVARFCTAEVLDVVDPPDGEPYLVTEFIDGPTLARAVAVHGPLGGADVERVAISVAAALSAIHGAGLVHRDLSPTNVLLSSFGPRVIDFGLARVSDDAPSGPRGRVAGTLAYMAPEQARGHRVSGAADVFAWGGLVLFAATGRAPFGDGPTVDQLRRLLHSDPSFEGLDDSLREVVRAAMRRESAGRPSAEELLRALTRPGVAAETIITSRLDVIPLRLPPGRDEDGPAPSAEILAVTRPLPVLPRRPDRPWSP
ncbi:serine/threonine-protein kinase, partial [Frankia sp. AgKG'84/4]|uniref:serine/threonine-protein kinase n=1 Tax=Frankia sp. AgKG'84/4 TaxID=573490 RepID=UPI0035B2FB95